MKSPNSLVIMMDNILSELQILETDPEYIKQMKQHINSMAVLTLLNFKSPKAKQKAVQVLEKSSK